MTALAKIHVLKQKAGLDDDSYRDLLERETGQRSAKGLTNGERLKVITALEWLAPQKTAAHASGPFARKLQALWIAGYNLGVVENRSDAAMKAFLKRQTGLDHERFLRNPTDAKKAIEALKLWIIRVTGNDSLFCKDGNLPALYNDVRFQVCLHIWSELIKRSKAPAGSITVYLLEITGKGDVLELDASDWIEAQNALGKLWRAVKNGR